MKHKIYVASSWRNLHYPAVVTALRAAGHEVYDFRHEGFSWTEISADWADWTMREYVAALDHPAAVRGYGRDKDAMEWANVCVLVLPSGRSAHIEAGWFTGCGKPLIVLQPERCEPELMYKLATAIVSSVEEVVGWLVQMEAQAQAQAQNPTSHRLPPTAR